MTQQVIVYIIGIAVAIYIVFRIYMALTGRSKSDPCSGCSGCDLKKELDAKKCGCTSKKRCH